MGADGSCLTWLTNGTPASFFATWRPGSGTAFDPGTCDPNAREVRVERAAPAPLRDRLWLGPRYRGLLLSDVAPRALSYDDCAGTKPRWSSRSRGGTLGSHCAACAGRPSRLPPPRVPRILVQRLEATAKTYARERTITRTAHALGIARHRVSGRLRLREALRAFGPYRFGRLGLREALRAFGPYRFSSASSEPTALDSHVDLIYLIRSPHVADDGH